MVRDGVQRKLFEVKNNHRTSFEGEHSEHEDFQSLLNGWHLVVWKGGSGYEARPSPETPTLR